MEMSSWGFLVLGGIFLFMGIALCFTKSPAEFKGKVTAVDKDQNNVTVKYKANGQEHIHTFKCQPDSPIPKKGVTVVMTGTPNEPESLRFRNDGITYTVNKAKIMLILFGIAFIAAFFFVK